jgi:predicted nucleotide-binding protein (sugar kinase/HSP70/actin superfamily)
VGRETLECVAVAFLLKVMFHILFSDLVRPVYKRSKTLDEVRGCGILE